MRKFILNLAILFLFSGINSYAGVNVEINLGGSPNDNYYRSLANYYRVPDKDVYFVRDRGIPNEELPVIFYLASLAGVAPSLVADEYRRPGITLYDLTRAFGLYPDIYHYPIKTRVDGPPYGKAYGYYKNKPKNQWKDIKLNNSDIINLVNLRFISESRGVDPDDIIKGRKAGKDFISIDYDISKSKGKPNNASGKKDFDKPKPGKGNSGVEKNKGKGQDKGKGKEK